jgi:hypothetical protein
MCISTSGVMETLDPLLAITLNFSARWELVLVSRRNEPSGAVQRFVEIARNSGAAADRRSVAPQQPRRSHPRRQ